MSFSLFENDVEFYSPGNVFLKGSDAPHINLLPHVGREGSPSKILERHDPHTALEIVTRQHARIADWIRAQEWGQDVPKDCWRYITATNRMKACRKQLEAIVESLEASDDRY